MKYALVVLRGDLYRRMPLARGRTADQQWLVDAATLHFLGDVYHLVERRRDQPREADHIAFFLDCGVEDAVARDHDAQVDDLVVVAAKYHAHDVLADVVDVALYGREHQPPPGSGSRGLLVLFHEGRQVGDGALHRASALYHLGQEHLPGAEEISHDPHAVHQRSFDHFEGPGEGLARLLGVLFDEIDDAVDERVGEAFSHGLLPPGEIHLLPPGTAADRLGELHHALGGVWTAVEEDVLDALQ